MLTPEIQEAEMAARMTALSERVYFNPEGVRSLRAAISADGRWGYEREGRNWTAFARPGQRPAPILFAGSLTELRRMTFDHDHPMHGPEPEPKPVRFSLA